MTAAAHEAAAILWQHWRTATRLASLPESSRPRTRGEGYAIQSALATMSSQAVVGWKIAATSAAGQRHIAVDGPLAGRLLSGRRLPAGSAVSLEGNIMRVAEAEFAFRLAHDLPPRDAAYRVDEVVQAVDSLHPAIEIPDSRYAEFVRVGGPQLIADMACACWFTVGAAAPPSWRDRDLAQHGVTAHRNGAVAGEGSGANVLGDPRIALTWIANELIEFGQHLKRGEVVITGTCVPPVAVEPGDHVRMDFGEFGTIDARFT